MTALPWLEDGPAGQDGCDCHDSALAYARAGLSVIPIRDDGSKAPAIPSWRPYQQRPATVDQVEDWFREDRHGIAVVAGSVSGGIELLEFEAVAVDSGLATRFRELCEAAGLGEVVARIADGCLHRSPRGGFHLVYRTAAPLPNQRLATRSTTPEERAVAPQERTRVLIETRGEGGYFVVPPSHGGTSASGHPWSVVKGGLATVATISVEERDALFDIARSLGEVPPVERAGSVADRGGGPEGGRPGDRYNGAPDAQDRTEELLVAHGWRVVHRRDGVTYLRRPGKDRGISATLGRYPGLLYVFSTSTEFEAPRGYLPFSVYAILEHGGDFTSAAAAIADMAEPPGVVVRSSTDPGGAPDGGGGPDPGAPRAGDTRPDGWPEPLEDAAYHGILGDIVRTLAPHTEADPVGILGSLLVMAGVVAGGSQTLYQGAWHAPNLFVALVGETSTARKGTAHGQAAAVLHEASPGWDSLLVPGLGSGEGLIGRLQKGDEPRALILETEFGRLLRVMAREGSTLSPMIRDAWDGVPLGRFLARESALVPVHHVGLLAHITPAELLDRLTSVDAANGFGNRFLWLAVERQRLVPFPRPPAGLLGDLVAPLSEALTAARERLYLEFSEEAADHWEQTYLASAFRPRTGLLGALTARSDAHRARLSLLYAILDRSRVIELVHLRAADAFVAYAERSARYVFGDSTGDRHADLVLRLLRDQGELDRQEVKQETGLRLGADLDRIEAVLVGLGLAELAEVPRPDGTGRRKRVLRLRNGRNGRNGA